MSNHHLDILISKLLENDDIPYLASTIAKLEFIPTSEDVIFALGDQGYQILYNPSYIEIPKLELKSKVPILCCYLLSCVLQIILLYSLRRKDRIHILWNIAVALEVNCILATISPNKIKLPAHALRPVAFGLNDSQLAEEYYQQLLSQFNSDK